MLKGAFSAWHGPCTGPRARPLKDTCPSDGESDIAEEL